MALRVENFVLGNPHHDHPQYGDWRKMRELGAGAFGAVYMWRNVKTGEEIAIKKCKIVKSEAMVRWQTEMKMMEDMKHTNIVSFMKIPDALKGEYPGACSLGMEYCSLGDMRKFLAKPENLCGVQEHHVIDLMGDIGSAIKYLHEKNNMHRDLKPENIVLKPRPGCEVRHQFKITDLGYAKDLDLASCGHSFVGTLAYLAPEVAIGSNLPESHLRYYTQVDYWSFGLVVFECITGKRPFLANMTPIMALNAVKRKKDDDIYAWRDTKESQNRFEKTIPPPHQLNPHLEREITLWLRLMLRVDEKQRGGGNQWYDLLTQKILSNKYAKVLNVQNMKLMTFPLEESAFGRAMQLKIHREAKIPVTDQLLLLRKGEVPNATQRILVQLESSTSHPEDAVIFLFDKSEKDWPEYKCETPLTISQHRRASNAAQPNRDERRIMYDATHDILKNIKIGMFFYGALAALLERVRTVSKNLQDRLKEFTFTNQKTIGMVKLFKVSLEKDIAENNAQDNSSEICADKAFRDQCQNMAVGVEEWTCELEKGESLIKEAEEQLLLPGKYFPGSKELETFRESLLNIKKESIDSFQQFRLQCRACDRKMRESPSSKDAEKKYAAFRQTHLRGFIDLFWSKIVKILEDALNPQSHLRKMMRFYINHHIKLEAIYFEMSEKSHQYLCIASELREKQESRQRNVWIMLQYMKDVYNLAFTYEKDESVLNDLEEQSNGLQGCMDRMMRDKDLSAVLSFAATAANQQLQAPPTVTNADHPYNPTLVSSSGVHRPHIPATAAPDSTSSPSGVRTSPYAENFARGSANPSSLRFSELQISPGVSATSGSKTGGQ